MVREYTDQSQFNLGLLYLQGTFAILRSISGAFMSSDRHKALLGLKTLYREIACKLKQTEREDMENSFNEINPYLKVDAVLRHKLREPAKYGGRDLIKSKIAHNNNIIFKKLETIDIVMRDYLEKHGLLIPNKKDMTRFENLE